MCGIVALFHRDGRPVVEKQLVAMRDALTHRGPDDAGSFVDGPAGIAMRRLEIIDLAGGHQPMANPDGSVHLVFNGEIYNYPSLRQQLTAEGYSLSTESDTETILGLYELYGEACVDHLCGMFGFALWDRRRQQLFAARDRLGIKPLYILELGNTIALASEIKAFRVLGPEAIEPDSSCVPEYLRYRNLGGDRTFFRHIRRLNPGESIVISRERAERRTYWQFPTPTAERRSKRSPEDWSRELEELFADIIDGHLLSDVPLGTFNSGGVDSSLVTALVARRRHEIESLNTYSVGFDDPEHDETPYANLVKDRFKTQHHRLVVDPARYSQRLRTAIWYHDEPLNHPHTVHLMELCHLARRKVTVVLTGEGSDELFGGYTRYRLLSLLDRLPLRMPGSKAALKMASRFLPPHERQRAQAVLEPREGLSVASLSAFVDATAIDRVLRSNAEWGVGERAGGLVLDREASLPLALAHDQQNYLQSLLQRMDRMSMAASLEGRVPFLDHRLVEWAAQVPIDLKVRGLETKFLVKTLARRHLPEAIVSRRKAGFSVPVGAWLRPSGPLEPFVTLLSEPRTLDRGLLEPDSLLQICREHQSGEKNHAELLWGLLNLELWHRTFVESPLTEPDPRAVSTLEEESLASS